MRRPLTGLAGGTLLLALLATAPATAAPARPALLDPSKPFAADAVAHLLTLDLPAASPALLPQTNVDVANTHAAAQSTADLDADKTGPQRTYAEAATTGDSALLDNPLDIQSTVASAAPNDAAAADVLLPLDLTPLLNLQAITTAADASWVSDTQCVESGTPLSEADQSAVLLDMEQLEPLVELQTDSTDGAVDANGVTYLTKIAGPGADQRAVQARATTDVTGANILGALDDGGGIGVTVLTAPSYLVSASGLPGGASVTGDDPVVQVDITGQPAIVLNAQNQTEDVTLTGLTLGNLVDTSDTDFFTDLAGDLGIPIEDLTDFLDGTVGETLAALQPIVRLTVPIDKAAAADGTSAHASAAILNVQVLPPDTSGLSEDIALLVATVLDALGLDVGQPLLDLTIGPVSSAVRAPAGGIDCSGPNDDPLRELNKHASAQEVAPGGTFDYAISVPNRGPCTVTDVTVVDEITGPGFEVIATEPEATIDGGTVTFDVSDLAPNETVELTITVQVADDAPDGATFDDLVTATGTCDGRPVGEDEPVLDTPTVRDDFTGPCSVEFSNKDASHDSVEPGETFAYYVHVFNSGAEACEPVDVADTLDDRVTFVSCTYGCEHEGQDVSWHLDSLAGGSSVVMAVVVQTADDATGTLENTAVITPGNGDPTTVTWPGPVIGSSVPRQPVPPIRVSADEIPQSLPHTGAGVPTVLVVVLGAGSLALFALRRRTTA